MLKIRTHLDRVVFAGGLRRWHIGGTCDASQRVARLIQDRKELSLARLTHISTHKVDQTCTFVPAQDACHHKLVVGQELDGVAVAGDLGQLSVILAIDQLGLDL